MIKHKRHRARKFYRCDDCERRINPGEYYYRMFGSAEDGQSPFELFHCLGCHHPCIYCQNSSSQQIKFEKLLRIVTGALRSCINDHGPITSEWIGSAGKRIAAQLKGENETTN